MPTKNPTLADFPSNLTLTITPPPAPTSSSNPSSTNNPTTTTTTPSPNILILLHGLGDSTPGFTPFAHALDLPETAVLTIQAPNPLPLDLPGFHWGDDISFDPSTGGLDMDAGFSKSLNILVNDVVRGVLVRKCGYGLHEIMILGFGQGGMVGLLVARELGKGGLSSSSSSSSLTRTVESSTETFSESSSLAGVISVGAPYPLSGSRVGKKSRTPVLLLSGRDSEVVTDGTVKRSKDVFEFVDVRRYARKGDGMPRSRDEVLPVMEFFAKRLRSRRGVPEGSIEIS